MATNPNKQNDDDEAVEHAWIGTLTPFRLADCQEKAYYRYIFKIIDGGKATSVGLSYPNENDFSNEYERLKSLALALPTCIGKRLTTTSRGILAVLKLGGVYAVLA